MQASDVTEVNIITDSEEDTSISHQPSAAAVSGQASQGARQGANPSTADAATRAESTTEAVRNMQEVESQHVSVTQPCKSRQPWPPTSDTAQTSSQRRHGEGRPPMSPRPAAVRARQGQLNGSEGNNRPALRPDTEALAGNRSEEQSPPNRRRRSAPSRGSQQRQLSSHTEVDHLENSIQQDSQNPASEHAFYSCVDSCRSQESVMANVTGGDGSIEADLAGCSLGDMSLLEKECQKIQLGGVPADEPRWAQDELDSQADATCTLEANRLTGVDKLTNETFMDALLEVLRNDKPYYAYQPHPLLMLFAALGGRPDDPDYVLTLAKKLVAYDMESLRMSKGMGAYPLWSHRGVHSPTWAYDVATVENYDPKEIVANVKGHLFISKEQVDMALDGSISEERHTGSHHAVYQPTYSQFKERMREVRNLQPTEALQVHMCASTEIAGVVKNHISSDELLLTFASNQCDEQALARDIHRAAPSDEVARQQIERLSVCNVYKAFERIKQTHDCITSPASEQQATDKKQPAHTLDVIHAHFVGSCGRRFVTPVPKGSVEDGEADPVAVADFASRHTPIYDAVLLLEVTLAFIWWMQQCKDTIAFQELFKEMGNGAIHHGVDALRLSKMAAISDFDARSQSRVCAERAPAARPHVARARQRQTVTGAPKAQDLVKMQHCDPTVPVYKSSMAVKGWETLQKWAK